MRSIKSRLDRLESVAAPTYPDLHLIVTFVELDDDGRLWGRDGYECGIGWGHKINGPLRSLED